MEEAIVLEKQLEELRIRHKELDDRIDQLTTEPYYDQLHLRRLQKERLFLKDRIVVLEESMYPDLIA